MGKIIVIEGLDGSGKATQANLLTKALKQKGFSVRQLSFPHYKSDSSALVKMYLKGDFGSHPDDVNAYASSTFYAVDRYASYKMDWQHFYHEGGIIICDRYTTSNIIYQCAKLKNSEWDAFTAWLKDFEYKKLGIPSPDLVLYLEVPISISEQLLLKRYEGDPNKKDIHEDDKQFLQQTQQVAQWCVQHENWQKINCFCHKELRSIDAIHIDTVKQVKIFLEKE